MPPELDEGAAPDPGGFTPVTQEELDAATAAEGIPEKPVDEPAAEATPATPAETVYEINGKKYTAAQIEELEKGSMRLSDYSRDKNTLTARQQMLEDREERLRLYEERLRAQGGQGEEEDLEPESVENRIARIEQEQLQRDYDAHCDRAVVVYERTLQDLFKENGITDKAMQERIDKTINDFNPDTRDLKQLESSVRQLFDVITTHGKAAVEARLRALKQTPKVPSARGAGVVPVTPGAKKRPSFDDPVTDDELAGG